ncbi:restriction endonuclease subunit S [Roseateles sp. LKC17W]|uniref:Restriction endonuclease subunit S n=1 Tax=Pelomonas margarita TaxID=3299031 RepID=A0ABW7FJI4_9BURK
MTLPIRIELGEGGPTPYLPLAEIAPLVRRVVAADPEVTYTELGVRSFNKGIFHRRTVKGAEFTWQELYLVQKSDLVFSNIMAWEGAVALAGADDHGCVGNHRMLTCACDERLINPAFLAHYFKTPEGMNKLVGASSGTVARNRTLTAAALGKMTVPVPPLAVQSRIVRHLELLAEKTQEIETHLDAVERDAQRLIRSYIFASHGERSAKRRLSELVSQRQPDVAVDGTAQYRFAGVYSFGRGVFPSAVKMGSEFAYERLSTVRAGDFIYPKLMAWEGALGVVPAECDGMVVSPEFPVFTVNTEAVLPEVLDIYFRTPDVWPTLAEISGGTNARRRRLQPSAFLSYEMPVPSMAKQLELRAIYQRTQLLKAKHTAIRQANAALLPATLERVFAATEVAHA